MPDDPADLVRTRVFAPDELLRTGAFDVTPLRLAGDGPATDPLVGRRLGDFQLTGRLGAGGMGTVYRAVQVSRDRPAAVKVLAAGLGDRSGFARRFQREVRLMARLVHPHIVRGYAAGETGGFFYLGMELCEGGSLADWLGRLGALEVADAVRVGLGLAAGLGYAHDLGMVHRDVKPDNVLFAADGTPKLGDLGLAKAADDPGDDVTRTGVGIGTPLYAPPEQADDAKRADARSDLYALGGVLYHALTGRVPHPGPSLVEVRQAKTKGEFPPARSLNPAVPPALDRLLGRLLAKVPDHRPASAAEVAQELELTGLADGRVSFFPAS